MKGGAGDQGKRGGDHNDRIKTRPLPVAAAQVQPHSKLVKSQRQADAVKNPRHAAGALRRLDEQKISGDARQQKNPIVEVVYMRCAEMKIKVGNPPRHDEDHNNSRRGK